MAQRILRAEKFKGFTDLPLYNRDTSWLKTCQNFRVMPSGYLEARQGFQKLKPSGGTAADPITAGIFTGAHEHTSPVGWVMRDRGGAFSGNLAHMAYFELFETGVANGDNIYFGADGKFGRVVVEIVTAAVGTHTLTWQYYNGSTWTALTGPTEAFAATGTRTVTWRMPTDWAATAINTKYKYWVRCSITAFTNMTTRPRSGTNRVFSDWPGMREIFVAGSDSAGGTGNGILKYYGVSGTTASWTSVSSTLSSNNYPRVRFASYRGILYAVNGVDQKRWNGDTLGDVGFTAPALSAFTATVDAAGTTLSGTFKYAISYGYGPGGEWGESNATISGDVPTPAADEVDLAWTFSSTPTSGIVDAIYIYRTPDLASVPSSAQSTFPYYRIATVTRDAAGALPTTYTDSVQALPFPPVDLNIATLTPPSGCKFITLHKNRLFIGSNPQYPGRIWWSEPFEVEAFDTDENFADFTRSTGGQVTGMIEFADQVVVFTEDKMFGISNVDQDQPAIYEIAVFGCIAPDSIAASDGNLMWLGRNGVYRWTGEGLPQRVSNDTSTAFGKLSFETHGGSRAVIHNRMYETHMMSNDATESALPRYRYDLVTDSWSRVVLGLTGKIAPLVTVTAPLGHADAGTRHPLYGQTDKAGTNYAAYIGEYTESDDGSAFTLTVDVHFGPPLYKMIRPDSAFAVYVGGSNAGWNTPTLDGGVALNSAIGTAPTMQTAGPVDGAADYSQVTYVYTQSGESSGDQVVRFTVATVTTSGTITAGSEGKLLGVYLDADVLEPTDGV